MSKNVVFMNKTAVLCSRNLLGRRFFCSEVFTVKSKDSEELVVDVKPTFEETIETDSVMAKRNKSRLNEAHRNILMGRKPYKESVAFYHDTVKYKRKMLGRYGMEAVGVPAGVAWPLPEEVEEMKEYERVAFPKSLQERWEMLAQQKAMKQARIKERDDKVAAAMQQMNQLIQEFKDRIVAKEKEREEAQKKKNMLIALVRKELGDEISIHDDRFKQLLKQKGREVQKMKKEAKRKTRIDKFLKMNTQIITETTASEASEEKEEAK